MKKIMLTLGVAIMTLLATATSAFACSWIAGEYEMPKTMLK